MVSLLFELHYLFDNTSILELHSCIWRVNSGVNLFSLSIHIGSTLKQFCVVRHIVCVSASWRAHEVIDYNYNLVNFICNFCTFLQLFVSKLFFGNIYMLYRVRQKKVTP